MSQSCKGLFIVWRIFQRRTESLADKLELEVRYYHYPWEDKSKLHKAFSYILKGSRTLHDLVRLRPDVVFTQLPPTPLLYIVYLYSKVRGCKVVADCHNAMVYSKWLNWPFAERFLQRVDTLLVHNHDVESHARELGLDAVTLHDPLPAMKSTLDKTELQSRFSFAKQTYIIAPWSFAADEPVDELISAAVAMPDIVFVMTWFAERLPAEIAERLPPNLVLTGFLDDENFTGVFAHAHAALVLTTREGTQPSGATEAIALGVPLILSDIKTTRRLYGDVPVYIDNTSEGIQQGIRQVSEEREMRRSRIADFRSELDGRLRDELANVKALLKLPT